MCLPSWTANWHGQADQSSRVPIEVEALNHVAQVSDVSHQNPRGKVRSETRRSLGIVWSAVSLKSLSEARSSSNLMERWSSSTLSRTHSCAKHENSIRRWRPMPAPSNSYGLVETVITPRSSPAGPNDVEAFLEEIPTGLIRDPEYGLGLLKELRPIVSAIEQIDSVRHLVISETRASEIDNDRYILAYREFESIRSALGRTHRNALSSAMIDKRALVHNALLNSRLPGHFSEKHRPYKRDTIFKAVSGPSGTDKLSSADRSAALAIVSKSKRELAQTDAPGLLELRREIELITLEQLIERIEALMKSKKAEQVWQQLFFDNPFILSLAFSLPIVVFGGGVSVGGRNFTGAGEKIADFLYRNGLTDNITVLEIKTPETDVLGRVYRGGVYAPSFELTGGINQTLDQRYQLQKSIAAFKDNSRVTNVESYAVKCIIVIGRMPVGHDEKKSLELFRNNLNDVTVVTFDELLEKLRHLHVFLSTEPK